MTDSEILQALIDAEIAMAGKGYPDADISLSCDRNKWSPGKPWFVGFRVDQYASRYALLSRYETARAAADALISAVAGIERKWDDAAVAATLGIAPYIEVSEAAE